MLSRVRSEVLQVLNSFVGTYQMLPWRPGQLPPGASDPLFQADSYSRFDKNFPCFVLQRLLDDAKANYQQLEAAIDPARMIYVAGALATNALRCRRYPDERPGGLPCQIGR